MLKENIPWLTVYMALLSSTDCCVVPHQITSALFLSTLCVVQLYSQSISWNCMSTALQSDSPPSPISYSLCSLPLLRRLCGLGWIFLLPLNHYHSLLLNNHCVFPHQIKGFSFSQDLHQICTHY